MSNTIVSSVAPQGETRTMALAMGEYPVTADVIDLRGVVPYNATDKYSDTCAATLKGVRIRKDPSFLRILSEHEKGSVLFMKCVVPLDSERRAVIMPPMRIRQERSGEGSITLVISMAGDSEAGVRVGISLRGVLSGVESRNMSIGVKATTDDWFEVHQTGGVDDDSGVSQCYFHLRYDRAVPQRVPVSKVITSYVVMGRMPPRLHGYALPMHVLAPGAVQVFSADRQILVHAPAVEGKMNRFRCSASANALVSVGRLRYSALGSDLVFDLMVAGRATVSIKFDFEGYSADTRRVEIFSTVVSEGKTSVMDRFASRVRGLALH